MAKTKVLYITQEMRPYTALSEISDIVRKLPEYAQSKGGMEIRILMPRFGTINERRHRLHEVVRLSGMNIIVDDDDFPLIIKVASVQGARMQVYFLDNEDFFKRKSVFEDQEGKPFDDNADRMVFFCKGVIETVRKFGWGPDIVHCHGWMTSLIPFYLRTAYQNDPLFTKSKIVYSMYDNSLESTFNGDFLKKASINNLTTKDLNHFGVDDDIKLHQGASMFSDGIILGSESLNGNVSEELKAQGKTVLEYQTEDTYLPNYIDFYKSLLEE